MANPEPNGWYLYKNEYYAKVCATPIDSNLAFNNGATIVNGITYWFKCEPIVWNVLNDTNGTYYLLSSAILDTHQYNNYYSGIKDGHYANNYEHSEIRSWLNSDFYNSAFALDNDNILTTIVDNTEDKVFLLSYQDYLNNSFGFSSSTVSHDTRYCKPTDWAKAVGVNCYKSEPYQNNATYWTRSPYYDKSTNAYCVNFSGGLNYGSVHYADYGVRPAIELNIE